MQPGLIRLRHLPRTPERPLLRRRPDRADQLEDYAARKGWGLDTARRWLAPILDERAAARALETGARA